jgi:HK97 gp10 family phage protein
MAVRLDTAKLDRIIATFPREAEGVVKSGAQAVQGYAANAAPVDTGALRNSIHASPAGDLLWWVGDGVEYGIYQELGTSRMAAHPFMVPAVERTQKPYTAMWIALFNRL